MNTRLCIFDLDGTILYTLESIAHAGNRMLRELGGKITVTADAHSRENVTFAFETAEQAARDAGFTELWEFNGEGFAPRSL